MLSREYADAIADSPTARAGIHPLSGAVLRRVPRVLFPMTALLVLGVLGLALRERGKDFGLTRRAAEGVVRLQARTVEREVEHVATLLPYLAGQAAVANLLAGERDPGGERVFVELLETIGQFDRVRLLDGSGREVLRVDATERGAVALPASRLQREEDQDYLDAVRSIAPGSVYVGALTLAEDGFRIVEPHRPVLRFATPLESGIFELEYRGRDLFDSVTRAGEQLPGWTALVNPSGYFLESPEGERSWGFLFGVPPTFAANHGAAWKRISGNTEGAIELGDGLYVHRRISTQRRPGLARSELRLQAVAFVPSSEVYRSSGRTVLIVFAGALLVWAALGVLAWRLAFVGTVRAARERQLAESRRGLRQLSARLMDAQEEERRNISRDLHDELGQEATALIIELKRAARADGEAKDELIGSGIAAAESLLQGLHRISSRLRSNILDDLGLFSALGALCTEFEDRFRLTTRCELDFEDGNVPDAVARNVYRLVQEALTNAFKHAQAKEIKVHVHEEDGALRVAVVDDGVGFEVGSTSGGRLGLLGMRERVEQLRGNFTCTSQPGAGTRIEAVIPLPGAAR